MTKLLGTNESSTDEARPKFNTLLPQTILNSIFTDFLKNEYFLCSEEETKSAQQQVLIIQVARNAETDKSSTIALDEMWSNCLKNGRYRLVVRIWKGGSNWWNLNRNEDPLILARQEIEGYQWAHQAFQKKNQEEAATTYIPRVLHHQLSSDGEFCWAVLEYVGQHSTLFDNDNRLPDSSYMERMVKVRHEFGYDEPHPRWGRVQTEDCLEYATMVLKEVVLPLQRNTKLVNDHDTNEDNGNTKPKNFGTMLHYYQKAFEEILASNANHGAGIIMQTDKRMEIALETVKEAVSKILPMQMSHIPPMSPVLVHLDLQPQNLLFYRLPSQSSSSREDDSIHVSSVLDWEDASVADPRFEVLLICRKVCAKRSQADALWSLYQESVEENSGPIGPWLQLECIHSILTLLLQSMDLLNGGRNPWETKKDLWGKLQREFHRWDDLNRTDHMDVSNAG